VHTLAAAAASPQCEARGFLRRVRWEGPAVSLPGPLFRSSEDAPALLAPPPGESILPAAALASWAPRAPDARETSGRGAESAPAPGGKPLAGVRILDFTQVVAGPVATRVLGDLGADVVKLQTEERSRGTAANDNPFFTMWNRSKRGACLNMKHPAAADVVRRLVDRVDVVMENFAPGVLERWGIGYARLREWNPRVIYVALSGCGQGGPWRDFVTYAPTIHALCGLTSLTNPPGRCDVGHGISISDHVSGLAGAVAVLEALEERRRTGRGQLIDLSQLEVGLHLLGPSLLDLVNNGREARADGNRDALEDLVPNEVYRCADGEWLAASARSDAEWLALCAAIGDAELAAEPGLRGEKGRRAARARIDRRLAEWAAGTTASAAAELLQRHGVPAGKVQNARDIALDDPQLAARDCLIEVEHASLGRQQLDRFPAVFGGGSLDPYRPSPAFGEHTFEVYAELLGMSEAEIAEAIGDGLFV
jgi:crotonobetainyl-CoA:carnitine CoA-transferase CaiB-like acyl-CoA transferase